MVRVQVQILLPCCQTHPAPAPLEASAFWGQGPAPALHSPYLPISSQGAQAPPPAELNLPHSPLPAPLPRGPRPLLEAGGPHSSPSQWQQAATCRPALGQAAPGNPLCCVADPVGGPASPHALCTPCSSRVASHRTYGWWAAGSGGRGRASPGGGLPPWPGVGFSWHFCLQAEQTRPGSLRGVTGLFSLSLPLQALGTGLSPAPHSVADGHLGPFLPSQAPTAPPRPGGRVHSYRIAFSAWAWGNVCTLGCHRNTSLCKVQQS